MGTPTPFERSRHNEPHKVCSIFLSSSCVLKCSTLVTVDFFRFSITFQIFVTIKTPLVMNQSSKVQRSFLSNFVTHRTQRLAQSSVLHFERSAGQVKFSVYFSETRDGRSALILMRFYFCNNL